MIRAFLLLLHTLFTTLLLAQPASNVRSFSVRDGLPTNSITAIRQGPSGLIWIATWNGLCCYDGNRFTTFWGEPWGSDNALSTYRISAIGPDSQGNVWVRTYDGELYLLDGQQCQYINVGLLLQQKYNTDFQPRNIYNLPNGHTWINDSNGAMNLRIDDRQATNMDHIEIWGTQGHALKGTHIQKVVADKKGQEWIVTDQGMMRYGSEEFRKGVFDLTEAEMRNAQSDQKDKNAQEYMEQHAIGKHLIDRQGNLWFTHAQGLSLVNFKNYHTLLLPVVKGIQTRSVCCRRDGTVWAGSHDGYIAVYSADRQLLGWLTPQGQVSKAQTRFTYSVYALFEDRSGTLWIGTKGQGVFTATPAAGAFAVRQYLHTDDPYSLSDNAVYDFDQDENGNLWIATYGGGVNLVRSTADRRFFHQGNELKNYPADGLHVRRVTHNGQGCMLISTTKGLLTCPSKVKDPRQLHFYQTCHHPKDTASLQASDVAQTLVSKSGTVYVITMGGGIQRITTRQLLQDNLQLQTVKAMNQGEGSALSLQEDRQGNIWIMREAEVNRYNVKTGKLEQFGPNSMAAKTDITEALPALHPDGSLWVATHEGVLTFQPANMLKSQYQPQIVFTGIQYQGEQTLQPLLTQPQLDINSKDRRSFTISFAALDFENDYLVKYAYQLDERDDKDERWNYIGPHPSISFSELSPGKHTLKVKSTNADGVWCDNKAKFVIYIQPTFLERTWVRVLLVLFVIGLSIWGVSAYLAYRRKAKAREQRLESIMRQYRELQDKLQVAEEQETAEGQPAEDNGKPEEPRQLYRLAEPEIANPDEELMTNLMAYIERRIGDESLRIDDMAEAVGMGRTVFYGKIKELVGVSPSDFLKQVRMQRAQQLIMRSKKTFSEIAYSVGFTDPKYFTKCFKKETGKTPSEYRNHAAQE